jgi:hypothetical protein
MVGCEREDWEDGSLLEWDEEGAASQPNSLRVLNPQIDKQQQQRREDEDTRAPSAATTALPTRHLLVRLLRQPSHSAPILT